MRRRLGVVRLPARHFARYGVHRVYRGGIARSLRSRRRPSRHPRRGRLRRADHSEMGGHHRAKSWDIGFPTALRALAGALARACSPPRTFARAARERINPRLRTPRDLRRRLSRHLPSPSVQMVSRLDCLSWDFQRCPSVVLATPESTPGAPLRESLRDASATSRPRSVLVVFHHLDGFRLRCRARVLQRAPDPGVRPVSRRPAAAPRCRFAAKGPIPGTLPYPTKLSLRSKLQLCSLIPCAETQDRNQQRRGPRHQPDPI